MKRVNKRAVVWGLLILALGVMALSGYRLWQIRQMYARGDERYEVLREQVKTVPEDGADTEEALDIPELPIDFEALRAINSDAAAWLYGPDTVIDYPVMQATDYDTYLHCLPDGTDNANGTLFLDYNNAPDFSGRLNIIYGHSMKSGQMFGSLAGYKQQAYFEAHPDLYLYTADSGSYRVELIYGCVVDAGQWRERAFMYEVNLDALLSYAAFHTTFETEVTYGEEDRFLVLSTCSYEFHDARYVVIGVLRPLTVGEWRG